MKKSIALILIASSLTISAQSASAADWEFLPIVDDDYQYDPQLSLILGSMSPSDGDSGSMNGIEFSLNCPLLKAPGGVIRQQISVASYDEGGVEITSFELNPHYQINLAPNLDFGFGPGFGYVMTEGPGIDESAISLQAGASLSYTVGQGVIAGEARYQMMLSDIELNNGDEVDLNNTRLMIKLGYRF